MTALRLFGGVRTLLSLGSGVFTYRRIFKSSVPEFIEIKIPQNSATGNFEIRQLDDDPGATSFEIDPPLRSKMFELIAQVDYFKGLDLDVHRKIANLGEKTFEWERATETYSVTFNYTLNSTAIQLLQICEGWRAKRNCWSSCSGGRNTIALESMMP